MYTRLEDPQRKFIGVHHEDGRTIPNDPDNIDYQAFLVWNETASPQVDVSDGSFTLTELKTQKILKLTEECKGYIETHYEDHRQRTFTFLYANGLTNRKAYIQEVWDWIDDVFTEYYSKKADIIAAADESALNAITWDLPTSFDASDPLKTIEAARTIVD